MLRIFVMLACLTLIGFNEAFAQKCGTSHLTQHRLQDTAVAERVAEIEAFTQRWIQENQNVTQRSVVTIPIVVHVLYSDATSNISDAQIQSQITILNEDFRKTNANFSNTPTAFQSVAADTEIEFCLASMDPNGNPTNGITRTFVPSNFDYELNYYDASMGGKAPWDNTQYLNVWLGDLFNGSLLGFATPPGFAQQDDGVVVDYRAWGNVGTVQAPNDLGRTATHEVGHYLNLEHVWGVNGGCNDDDLVNDTPSQDTESAGCPTFPLLDNCTNSGDGVMFVNYMDYTDDACMTMFTAGQKARMRAALDGSRASLKTSMGCAQQTNTNRELEIPLNVYPNPAKSFIIVEATTDKDLYIEIINTIGQTVQTKILRANQEQISVSTTDLAMGVYFVKVSTNELFTTKKVMIID